MTVALFHPNSKLPIECTELLRVNTTLGNDKTVRPEAIDLVLCQCGHAERAWLFNTSALAHASGDFVGELVYWLLIGTRESASLDQYLAVHHHGVDIA